MSEDDEDSDESTPDGANDESATMPDEDSDESVATSDEDSDESVTTLDEGGDESSATPGEGEVYCRDCGAVISEKAEICPECGVRQQSSGSSTDDLIEVLTNGENPFVAAVYSAVLPGLGQFYNREPGKGAAILVAGFIAGLSVVVLIGLVLYPAVWLYAVYDAYVVADRNTPDA